jgi:hypothetical protein
MDENRMMPITAKSYPWAIMYAEPEARSRKINGNTLFLVCE